MFQGSSSFCHIDGEYRVLFGSQNGLAVSLCRDKACEAAKCQGSGNAKGSQSFSYHF